MAPNPSESPVLSAALPLPGILLQAFQTGQMLDAEGNSVPLGSNVSPEEAATLYRCVRDLKPATSAEVGFAQGVSATAILQALKDNGKGEHHVMDPFQANYSDVGLATIERAGLSARLVFHRRWAEEVVPNLPELDFAFIDASHLFDLTIAEFVMVDRKLRVGGMVAFHDMWMASQQKLIRYLLSNRAYEIVRTFEPPASPVHVPFARRLRYVVARIARWVPGHERIFSEELMKPFDLLNIPNLVLLRKRASDEREWTFHKRF